MLQNAAYALHGIGFDLDALAAEARLPVRLVREYVDPAVPRRVKVSV